MKVEKFINRKGPLILLGIVVLAFWQVAFLQNGMKWDFVDAYLPSRYFFSECILNNVFPFWNPYMLYGVPFYADLVSVFNPEFWIVGNMFGYSNVVLQYVFLGYVFVAGLSFRYFLKQFNTHSFFALAVSVAYMLSGFTIGNAQHVGFVAGYALFPLVVGSYLKFVRNPDKLSLSRSLLVFLIMVYASYPGLTIILAYYLFGIFIYYLVRSRKDYKHLKKLVLYHLLFAIVVIAACAVFWVSYVQARPFLTRYSGISLDLALKHPFTIQSFLSFVFPMTVGSDPAFFKTDLSMSNGYFGVISLVLLVYCWFKKRREKESYIFLFLGIFFFLTALGEQFVLRELLFEYVPLMNMFKYPAIFRAAGIFSFLAFLGINFSVSDLRLHHKKRFLIIIGAFILFLFLTVVYSATKDSSFAISNVLKLFHNRLNSTRLYEAIVLQGGLNLFLLFCLLFVVLRLKNVNIIGLMVLVLFAIDGIVATQLNLRYTVISDVKPVEFKRYLDASPKGFPIPGRYPIGQNSDKNASSAYTWMNNNVFPKRVSFDGLVSFKLDGYALLADNYPGLLEEIKNEPLLYFSEDIRENSKVENFRKNTVFLLPEDYRKYQSKISSSVISDQIRITEYSPLKIQAEVKVKNAQLLVYQQNYYKGWQVFVDGQKTDLIQSNFAHMAVFIPSGEHDVEFRYKNPLVIVSFIFSAFVFFVLLSVFFYLKIYSKPGGKYWAFAVVAIFISTSLINRIIYQKKKSGLLTEIEHTFAALKNKNPNNVTSFLSYASNTVYNSENIDKAFFIDGKNSFADFVEVLSEAKTDTFAFGWVNGQVNPEIIELINVFYPETIQQKVTANSGLMVAVKGDRANFFFEEDFEPGTISHWSKDLKRIKTDTSEKNRYFTFSSTEKWGTTLGVEIEEDLVYSNRITVVADIQMKKELKDVLLVVELKRGDERLEYEAFGLGSYIKRAERWTTFAVVANIDSELQTGDKLIVYFWNKDEAQFNIDNLRLRFH